MSTVGHYELIGRVAHSSASTVWKALDPDLDRPVAIKRLDASAADILRGEAQVLAALDHQNVVRVYDFVEGGPDAPSYLVEEWVEGATLAHVRDRHGRLDFAQALEIVRGALRGLAYCHEKHVLHGDLAPGNIIIDLSGVSKLIDFGSGSGPGVLRSGPSSATTRFAAPELLNGDPPTKRSDVYSAGAVLADLLHDEPIGAVGDDHLAGIRGPVTGVLAIALAVDPASRYADAGALLAALEDVSERTFGVGWTAAAGVAGLVSTTLGGGGVALITGAGAVAVGGEAVAVARAGAAPVGRVAGRTARSWWAGPLGIGAAVAVVAAVIGLVAVVSHRSARPEPQSGGPVPAVAATFAAAASPAAGGPIGRTTAIGPSTGFAASSIPVTSSAALVSTTVAGSAPGRAVVTGTTPGPPTSSTAKKAKALDGSYRFSFVRTKIVGTYVDVDPAAAKGARTVPLAADCEAATCSFRLGSGSGELKFAYVSGQWGSSATGIVDCYIKSQRVSQAKGANKWVLHAVKSGSRVTGFAGTMIATQTTACRGQVGARFVVTYRITMTRIGS